MNKASSRGGKIHHGFMDFKLSSTVFSTFTWQKAEVICKICNITLIYCTAGMSLGMKWDGNILNYSYESVSSNTTKHFPTFLSNSTVQS